MRPLVWIIGLIFLAGMVVAGCFALANDDDSMGQAPTYVASHDYGGYDDGGYGDYQGRDDDGGYSYDDRDGRECRGGGCGTHSRRCEGSRGDCRSSFSPGPFKDSPVTICAPYSCNSGGEQSGGNRQDRGDEPPPEGEPA